MSLSIADRPGTFSSLLKSWRQKRRLSQLELSLASGVSQRHVSFLESGRSQPSRGMILQLSETLDVPLRDRNDWLVAAGFAPVFRARQLSDPQMTQVMGAIQMMLRNHEPFPAIAMDRNWNVRLTNKAFEFLSGLIGNEIWDAIGGPERNMLKLFFHPQGVKPLIANWATIAPVLWHRAHREADALGGEEIKSILSDLRQFQDTEAFWAAEEVSLVPVLPVEVEKNGVRLSLFTVISTFGTAQDVTADELRIESFFPADDATDKVFRMLAV